MEEQREPSQIERKLEKKEMSSRESPFPLCLRGWSVTLDRDSLIQVI